MNSALFKSDPISDIAIPIDISGFPSGIYFIRFDFETVYALSKGLLKSKYFRG